MNHTSQPNFIIKFVFRLTCFQKQKHVLHKNARIVLISIKMQSNRLAVMQGDVIRSFYAPFKLTEAYITKFSLILGRNTWYAKNYYNLAR